MKAFDWFESPEGRARFSGSIAGYVFSVDERPHETFCVEVNGLDFFGEIHKIFDENGNNYNIEILSFGYKNKEDAGAPVDENWTVAFTKLQIEWIANIIRQLISVASKIDDPPFVLRRAKELFLGNVIFKNGWVRIIDSTI
jgi:hypothetical protein